MEFVHLAHWIQKFVVAVVTWIVKYHAKIYPVVLMMSYAKKDATKNEAVADINVEEIVV